jgi:hypothetical protein
MSSVHFEIFPFIKIRIYVDYWCTINLQNTSCEFFMVKRGSPVCKRLQLSKAFWITISIVYSYCLFVLYVFLVSPGDVFNPEIATQYYFAMKLTTVRLVVIVFGLIAYPVILSRFLKYAKYVTVALTAWAFIIYIEDYFVLYKIIEYPDRGLIDKVHLLRPIFIVSLMWMCFELTFMAQPMEWRYVKKKINAETGLLLWDASDGLSKVKYRTFQSLTFNVLLGVINLYVLLGFLLYLLVKGNLVDGINTDFLYQGYLSILDTRATMVLVFLMIVNISAYYNYRFKYLSIILFIYMLNSAIDITILFSDFSQTAQRPYFSVFQLSRPLLLICLIWIAIVHKEKINNA